MCAALHILLYYVLHCIPAELHSALTKNNVASLSPISMKSTTVQTLSVMCMHGTTNWWVGPRVCIYSHGLHASSWRRVWHGLATQLDSVRESKHALSCDLLSLLEPAKYIHRSVGLCISAVSVTQSFLLRMWRTSSHKLCSTLLTDWFWLPKEHGKNFQLLQLQL